MARVEAIPVEALLAGVTYEWESFAQLLDVIAARPLALNLGLMVGHSAIRRAVMGPAASTDRADIGQIGAMCTVLGHALAAGGFGFSTANVATQVDGDGRPTPPNLAEREELTSPWPPSAAAIPAPRSSSSPAPSSKDSSDADVALMADMSAAANRHLNWNTPLINRASPDLYKRQLRATDAAQARGGRVVPMFMPQNGPLRHDFKEAYVFRAIPGWADVFALEGEARIRALADPDTRARLKAAVDGPSEGLPVVVRNWAGYEVIDVEDPALAHLVGRTIAQLAAERDVTPFDAMLDVVVAAGLEVGFVRYQYPEDEWTAAARLEVLKDPRVVLGASDAGAHGEMMVGADFPTRCIGELARDKQIFTIESMIQQFCDVPARLYGLVDRGRIAPGMWADIVVFDLDRVGAGPMERVSDLPAGATRLTTKSTGVEHVLTAGTEVVRHGELHRRTSRAVAAIRT